MRPPLRCAGVVLMGLLLGAAGCTSADIGSPGTPRAMTLYGCEMTPGCMGEGGGGDPAPDFWGYYFGSTVTPEACFSPTGAGIPDVDLDGLSDVCERLLADRFRPALATSSYDCDARGEPYYAAKYFPAQGGKVRLAYLFAYYQDCGGAGLECSLGQFFGPLLTLNGTLPNWTIPLGIVPGAGLPNIPISNEDLCASHRGDSEFLILDLVYDYDAQHWYVFEAFFAAHWNTDGDHSRLVWTQNMEFPDGVIGGYPRVWVAHNKHGSFPTRYTCTNDGGPADSCNSNSINATRIRNATNYNNVGSLNQPRVGCVQGGFLVSDYPEAYSLECLLSDSTYFEGWQPYRLNSKNGTSSSYFVVMMMAFECYRMERTWTFMGGLPRLAAVCDDWGVNRPH